MLQDMSEARIFGVSNPPHPNMGIRNRSNPILSPMIHPFPLPLDIVLRDLHILRNIKRAWNHYWKLVEVEVEQHIMVPWEPHVPLQFNPQPRLFHLLHYMLKKFNWKNPSLDDFKAKLASYQACPKGWDEWIDNTFMASFGLWTHKNQVSHKCRATSIFFP
jgi:hypothetical protein